MSEPARGHDPDDARWADPAPAYDALAGAYAERFMDELDAKPFDRDLLERWSAAIPPLRGTIGPVADIGSGPGQIGAFVASHRPRVICLDRSLPMTAQVRRHQQSLSALGGRHSRARPARRCVGWIGLLLRLDPYPPIQGWRRPR